MSVFWCRMRMFIFAATVALAAGSAAARTNVAVFNFQMKTDTPEWVWLEKDLADRITTDLAGLTNLTLIFEGGRAVVDTLDQSERINFSCAVLFPEGELAERDHHARRAVVVRAE